MIQRSAHLKALKRLVAHHPVVALLGARQVGKTTLARELVWSRKGLTHFFDLESTADLSRLADPLLALSPLRGLPTCCAKALKLWPDVLLTTSFPGSLCQNLPKAKQICSGFEVVFLVRLPREVTSKAMNGGESSFELSLNGTFPSWGSRSRALRLIVSGQCLRTITPRSGTVRNSRAHSAFRTIPCGATSTHLKGHSWYEA